MQIGGENQQNRAPIDLQDLSHIQALSSSIYVQLSLNFLYRLKSIQEENVFEE